MPGYVGEVGLDASPRFYRSFDAQERVFERILRMCAEQGNKILTVHSVRAVSKVLQHLERALRQIVVTSCFTGSPALPLRLNALLIAAITSRLTPRCSSPQSIALLLSSYRGSVLTETDGPFVLSEGIPVRPLSVAETVVVLARVRGVDPNDMKAQILANLLNLVSQ